MRMGGARNGGLLTCITERQLLTLLATYIPSTAQRPSLPPTPNTIHPIYTAHTPTPLLLPCPQPSKHTHNPIPPPHPTPNPPLFQATSGATRLPTAPSPPAACSSCPTFGPRLAACPAWSPSRCGHGGERGGGRGKEGEAGRGEKRGERGGGRETCVYVGVGVRHAQRGHHHGAGGRGKKGGEGRGSGEGERGGLCVFMTWGRGEMRGERGKAGRGKRGGLCVFMTGEDEGKRGGKEVGGEGGSGNVSVSTPQYPTPTPGALLR